MFQYKHWLFLNFELKDFADFTYTPCMKSGFKVKRRQGKKGKIKRKELYFFVYALLLGRTKFYNDINCLFYGIFLNLKV